MEETRSGKSNFIISVIKGTVIALTIVLLGILIFAGVIKLASLGEKVIKPVNQFIKVIAVFVGCFFSLKGSMGFLKGGLVGILTNVLCYLVFSLLGGSLNFGFSFFIDLIFCTSAGILSGIITVNLKKDA